MAVSTIKTTQMTWGFLNSRLNREPIDSSSLNNSYTDLLWELNQTSSTYTIGEHNTGGSSNYYVGLITAVPYVNKGNGKNEDPNLKGPWYVTYCGLDPNEGTGKYAFTGHIDDVTTAQNTYYADRIVLRRELDYALDKSTVSPLLLGTYYTGVGMWYDSYTKAKEYLESGKELPEGTYFPTTSYAEIFNDYTNNVAKGTFSHAEGKNNTSNGEASHTEGIHNTASDPGTHAEGVNTSATMTAAHAEGYKTGGYGMYSHAEGNSSKSWAEASHSEGKETAVTALAAHAEGIRTVSAGIGSHVEGVDGVTYGNYSHVEGIKGKITSYGPGGHVEGAFCIVVAYAGHAEGCFTYVNGTYSHAEGYYTYATAEGAHSEGYNSYANDIYSHAEGYKSKAKGKGAHAEGGAANANEEYSHAEGNGTNANGQASHAEGFFTTAGSKGSHTEGTQTTVTGDNGHAEGNNSKVIGANGHAEGNYTIAGGNAHSEGNGTHAYGHASHAEGQGSTTTENATQAHAEGQDTLAHGHASHAEGQNTYVTGIWAHAEGYYNQSYANSSHVEGSYNYIGLSAIGTHVECVYNQAYAPYSHIIGTLNTIADSGAYSNVEGTYNQSYATYVHIEGSYNVIYEAGTYSHVEGAHNYSGAPISHIEGNLNASYITDDATSAPHIEGFGNTTYGSFSHVIGQGNIDYGKEHNSIEGISNISYGGANHIEGKFNKAMPTYDENDNTKIIAEPTYNHISGTNNLAYGSFNTIVGKYNVSYTECASLEGSYNIVSSACINEELIELTDFGDCHAEGVMTYASGEACHAEGEVTYASGEASHAEGLQTYALGVAAHAEGWRTTALGEAAHAEGYGTYGKGDYSHAEGWRTTAANMSSHAEGDYTIASGSTSHAEGQETFAIGFGSHTEGFHTFATGTGSHAEGYCVYTYNYWEHSNGMYNLSVKDSSHNQGGTLFTVGTGKSDDDRHNALAIYKDGTFNIDSKTNVTIKSAGYCLTYLGTDCITYVGKDCNLIVKDKLRISGYPVNIGTEDLPTYFVEDISTYIESSHSYIGSSSDTDIQGIYSVGLGKGIKTSYDSDIAVAQYNEDVPAYFVVGIGTDDTHRKNAFWISQSTESGYNGIAYFTDNIYVYGNAYDPGIYPDKKDEKSWDTLVTYNMYKTSYNKLYNTIDSKVGGFVEGTYFTQSIDEFTSTPTTSTLHYTTETFDNAANEWTTTAYERIIPQATAGALENDNVGTAGMMSARDKARLDSIWEGDKPICNIGISSGTWTVYCYDKTTVYSTTTSTGNLQVEYGFFVKWSGTWKWSCNATSQKPAERCAGSWGTTLQQKDVDSASYTSPLYTNTGSVCSQTIYAAKRGLMVSNGKIVPATGEDSASCSVSWSTYRMLFYGQIEQSIADDMDIAKISALKSAKITGRNWTVQYTADSSTCFVMAYPAAFGDISAIKKNGVEIVTTSFLRKGTVEYTNASGYKQNYIIYRSGTGTADMSITIS